MENVKQKFLQSHFLQAGHYSAQSGKPSHLCFSHWISNIDRSKNIFCPEVIFRNSYRSSDNLRRYLRSARTEAWPFPKLIIPIESFFTKRTLPQLLTILKIPELKCLENLEIILQNCFYQSSFDLSTSGTCIFFSYLNPTIII